MESTKAATKTGVSWVLKTDGDVQGRVRSFLGALWQQARLEGLIMPVYDGEGGIPGSKLLLGQEGLAEADPFVPLVRMEASKMVERLAREKPLARMGAVLHSCEARALAERRKRDGFDLGGWLLVGVDCLASFPRADYEWRVEKAGGVRELTREALRNARQGGISADRFRSACQMCDSPEAQGVDVCIGVVGLPVKEYALVMVREDGLAGRWRDPALGMAQITDGQAPGWLVEQHERVLEQMTERRERTKQRMLADLDESMPQDVLEWMTHLKGCTDCRACLEACPLYTGQLEQGYVAVAEWLLGCVACGICDDVCPNQLPLTAIVERIVYNMHTDLMPA